MDNLRQNEFKVNCSRLAGRRLGMGNCRRDAWLSTDSYPWKLLSFVFALAEPFIDLKA